MKYLITGATGFIGGKLKDYLIENGHDVISGSRKQSKVHGKWVLYDIDKQVDSEIFRNVDVVIHCAHDFGKNKGEANFLSTSQLYEKFQRINPKGCFVYISSYSARKEAETDYGKTKFRIEQNLLKKSNVVVIRPGFVVGDGGLYKKLEKLVLKFPIIPLFDGGKGELPVINIDLLCNCIHKITSSNLKKKEYNLFNREFLTMKELFIKLCKDNNKSFVYFLFPSSLALICLKILETLGIQLPVGHDNLKAFVSNQLFKYDSDLPLKVK